jgi:hypothetical protein
MPQRRAPGAGAPIGVQTAAVKSTLAFVLLAAALTPSFACKRQIGDDCKTATDCDPNGTRACDLSQPGGYCTIEGCNETTCPSEATCIRYFPTQFLTTPCNPDCEDRCPVDGGAADGGDDGGVDGSAAADAVVLRNDCAADEVCLSSGLCAPRSTERRYCVKVCSSNGDCRDGYECRLTGRQGSEVLSTIVGASTSFCAPTVPAN